VQAVRPLEHPALLPLRPVAGRYTRPRRALKRRADGGLHAVLRRSGTDRALDAASASAPPMDVLVLGVDGRRSRMRAAVEELRRSVHRVQVVLGTMDDAATPGLEDVTPATGLRGGKFRNANALLARASAGAAARPRWTIVIDHDVILPPRFLDRFLAASERFGFVLCQPALTLNSFGSHPVTRRRPGVVARETRFVEIGPVTAFREEAGGVLLPFPHDAGMGWGLDRHWPAVAAAHGWSLGIVDATPVGHEDAAAASAYSWGQAMAGAEAFLDGRPAVHDERLTRTTVRRYWTVGGAPGAAVADGAGGSRGTTSASGSGPRRRRSWLTR
jgi:hypothetical protein